MLRSLGLEGGRTMRVELSISYEHMKRIDDLDTRIREYVDQLEQRFGRIISCRVVVQGPHKHHRRGTHYQARIYLHVPRGEIAVTHEAPLNKAHEDVFVAVHDAFRAARRKLEERVRQHTGRSRAREVCPHGNIDSLNPGRDYGTILTADGHEVYFHRNSVVRGNFDDLQIGDEVRFCVEDGNKGPQASSVHIVGKHHVIAA